MEAELYDSFSTLPQREEPLRSSDVWTSRDRTTAETRPLQRPERCRDRTAAGSDHELSLKCRHNIIMTLSVKDEHKTSV